MVSPFPAAMVFSSTLAICFAYNFLTHISVEPDHVSQGPQVTRHFLLEAISESLNCLRLPSLGNAHFS